MPTDTGGVVGGVSDRELGTGASADDGFFAGVVDFDAPLASSDSGEVATATLSAIDGAMIAAAGTQGLLPLSLPLLLHMMSSTLSRLAHTSGS